MKNMIRYACGMLFAVVSCSGAAADAESIRHELEIFLSSGIGSVVSIVLLLLAQIEETNRILADIRDELSVLNEEDVSGTSVVEQSSVGMQEESAADYYDKIKYEP